MSRYKKCHVKYHVIIFMSKRELIFKRSLFLCNYVTFMISKK